MVEIVNGPNKKKLLKAFELRQQVTITLAGNKDQQLTIKMLEYNGDESSFNFVADNGDYGYYNTRKKHGQINSSEDCR